MQLVRIFLYLSIPLLILGMLKGGGFSAGYLELVMYTIPISLALTMIIGVFKKTLCTVNCKIIIAFLVVMIAVWFGILILYLFWKRELCVGFEECNFLTIPKIVATFFLNMALIIILRVLQIRNDE